MTAKTYLQAGECLRDSFRLAKMVLQSSWQPDVLLPLWRGGAPSGICVHELFSFLGRPLKHYTLKCVSYTGIGEHGAVHIENAEEVCAKLSQGEKILLVDDVFDSGKTIDAVTKLLRGRGYDVRSAVLYWKPAQNQTAIKPDWFVRTTEDWLVFPHELKGLSREEVMAKDPVLHDIIWSD